MGTENIKESLKVLIELGEGVDQALRDDGKISWTEGVSLGVKALKIWSIVKHFDEVMTELNDLDDTERVEIVDWVREELDIENDKAEEIIEFAVGVLLSITEFFEAVKLRNELKEGA